MVRSKFHDKNDAKKRRGKAGHDYHEKTLFPVYTAKDLLRSAERQKILKRIRQLTNLDKEDFEKYYQRFFEKFAEFVQIIPVNYAARLCGLLDEGLVRGYHALQYVHDDADGKPDPLFAYATFTVATLSDLGRLVLQYKIMMSDKDGAFLKEWLPCLGSMMGLGEFYKIRRYHGAPTRLSEYAMPLLARQAMPKYGFVWLSENTRLLNMWLAALTGDEDGGGALSHILNLIKQRMENEGLGLALGDLLEEFDEPLESEPGEDFYAWLKEGLEDGTISVNKDDSNVHIVKDGIFLVYPNVFKDFLGRYSRYRDHIVVYKSFNHLGVTKRSGYDFKFSQYFSESPFKMSSDQYKQMGHGILSSGKRSGTSLKETVSQAKDMKLGVVVKDPGLLYSKSVPGANPKLHAAGEKVAQAGQELDLKAALGKAGPAGKLRG